MFWFEHFRYTTEPATDAGAKGPAYGMFRDALPDALRLFRSLKERKPLHQIPPVQYLYRKGECTKDGQPAVRAVKGFARLPTDVRSNANAANVTEDEDGAAEVNPYVNDLAEVCPADLDRCPPFETSSEGMEPDYSDLYKAVEKEVAKDVGTKRAYNCSRCKQPKKKSCICKTTSEAVEIIANDKAPSHVPDATDTLEVEVPAANACNEARAYKCPKRGVPKKGHVCKTVSEVAEKIADAPDEAVEASVQATGPTGVPVKKRKRSPAPADGRRMRSKKA